LMKMKGLTHAKIVDITENPQYEKYLYRCLAPMPFRKYRRRQEYLEKAVGSGFRKKALLLNDQAVGMIEYAPSKISGYPITGSNIVVMHCIWVLRKARGHNFGRLLIKDMVKTERNATGFATIALDGHWSPWFKREQFEELGFKPLDSIQVTHRTKHRGQVFTIFLMRMPTSRNTALPSWDTQELLRGETFCLAHPLYRPQTCTGSVFETKQA